MADVPQDNACDLPEWLLAPEDYHPGRDHDAFLAKTLLSMTGLLARLRAQAVREGRLAPSAPMRLAFGLACILLTSLATNFAFVVAMLALVLVRAALLPTEALSRVSSTAAASALVTALLMLPAALLGQPHSAVLVGTKVLVSVGIAMTVSVTTPLPDLARALRSAHVPGEVVLALDLTIRGIYGLGTVAVEMLSALRLRSVGRNDRKAGAIGGIAGTLFLKAAQSSAETYDAMRCRGFEGDYPLPAGRWWRTADLAWAAALVALLALFLYLESQV